MKKISLVAMIIMVFAICSNAQFHVPSTKDVVDIKNKTLIVQLIDGDAKFEKKLSKVELAQYHDYINTRNNIIKSCFEEYWTLNEKLEFLSPKEVESKIRQGSDRYVIYYEEWGVNEMRSANVIRKFEGYKLQMKKADKKKPFFEITMPSEILNEADYKFILHQFEKFIMAGIEGKKRKDKSLYDKEKSLKIIEDKTLVVEKDWLEISEAEAQEIYGKELIITDNQEIDRIILDGDEEKLYLTNLWSYSKNTFMIAVVEASTQDIVNLYSVGGVQFDVLVPTDFIIGIGESSGTGLERSAVSLISFRTKFGLGKKDFKYITSKTAVKMNY